MPVNSEHKENLTGHFVTIAITSVADPDPNGSGLFVGFGFDSARCIGFGTGLGKFDIKIDEVLFEVFGAHNCD
jgi:hypothetical protein